MSEVLDELIKNDGAASIEVSWNHGEPIAYATIDADGDEIAVYEDCGVRDDRDPEVLAAAKAVMEPNDDWATSYPARFMVPYPDVRQALELILQVETNPAVILASLDDAVSNNLGD